MPISIGQITLTDVLDGATGPQGPAGTPGLLGLITSGSTLTLKGFDANGDLTASVGYIYVNGVRYAVPEYTYDLATNGGGKGYILFDNSWTTKVRYVKMIEDTIGFTYKDFVSLATITTTSTTYVIGEFNYNTSIYNQKIINPQSVENFQISSFMQILASNDITDVNRWAQALGIEQVFSSIAVMDALIDNLTVNKVESPNYTEDSSGMPTLGYKLDSATDIIKSVNAVFYNLRVHGGTFEGSLIHDSFKTVEKKNGATITIPSKTRWNTESLYSALSSRTKNNPLDIYTNIEESSNITVAYHADISMLYNDGGSSARTFTTFTSPVTGTLEYISTFRSNGISFIKYLYINGVEEKKWLGISPDTALKTHTYTFHVNTGDIIDILIGADSGSYMFTDISNTYYITAENDMTLVYNVTSNSEYYFTGYYLRNRYLVGNLSFTSPVNFNSSSHLDYVGLDALLTQLSEHPNNALTNITGSFYVNGSVQTATSYYKTSNSLSIVFSNAPTLEMYVDTAEVASFGYYNIAGSFTILSDVDSVKSKSLIPFVNATSNITEEGTDLGSAAFRIRNINMAGDIYGGGNIGGFTNITGSNVWGAVFN